MNNEVARSSLVVPASVRTVQVTHLTFQVDGRNQVKPTQSHPNGQVSSSAAWLSNVRPPTSHSNQLFATSIPHLTTNVVNSIPSTSPLHNIRPPPTTQFTELSHLTDTSQHHANTVYRTIQSSGQIYSNVNRLTGVSASHYSTIQSSAAHPVSLPHVYRGNTYPASSVPIVGHSNSSSMIQSSAAHPVSLPHVYRGNTYPASSVPIVGHSNSSSQYSNIQTVSTNIENVQQPSGSHSQNFTYTQPVSTSYGPPNSNSSPWFSNANGLPRSTPNVLPFNTPSSIFQRSANNTYRHMEAPNLHDPNAQSNIFRTSGTQVFGSTGNQSDLTPSQIAARHVVPRMLPLFFGDVEKFPSFLTAFETSTKICGFTNGENHSRLMESLKGTARDFVEQLLLVPDDVPRVIETLTTLFGKPEYIIYKLLEKISKQPAPQTEDLASLVRFSLSVQNICGTIKSTKATEHLRNPSLMKALVDKLPPSIQLNWAVHKQNVPNANLDTLGTWLQELGKLACSVTGPPKVKNFKKGEKDADYMNAQIESPTFSKKENRETTPKEQKQCKVCKQKSCQSVKECGKFKSLSVKDRWSVKEHGFCIRCFGNHQVKRCKSKQMCNIDNCHRAHNPLLHENDDKTTKNGSNARFNLKTLKIVEKRDRIRILYSRISGVSSLNL
ncbi:hypothetical protein Bhyg_08082 [Pseudolycoriella hygida]|uniref:Uncharacterized protein n=1 Tax=Pseudolycoriella hygida TaxID=35572 RepID=A0A9Q0N469_9DIPT|nr:hypothetical protein Bhyg_08082 [Pseudolycoriella hygida]